MHLNGAPIVPSRQRQVFAFTLAEVVISLAIAGLVFGGTITAYIQSTRNAEWTGYSLAAQALAIQQIEQARSAVWDPALGKNEITNLSFGSTWSYNASTRVGKGSSWTNLDLPVSGNRFTRATNFVTISMLTNVTGAPGVSLQVVQVDTAWPFMINGKYRLFTNSICTYLAPDNRDPGTL